MGGLSHYLEEEGLATTQISLVREHTQKIRPPRALWVPFDLGRPLGPPQNPEFQKKVALAALRLLEEPDGPAILREFQEDEPPCPANAGPLACPVSFGPEESTDSESLAQRFRQEVAGLATWYNAARGKHGRTMADTAGLSMEEAVEFLMVFAQGRLPENPRPGFDLGLVLKAVGEDLKAYYFEAMTAQPGGKRSHRELRAWFWNRTVAAQVFKQIKEFCDDSDDKTLKLMGGFCLVPRVQG